MPSIYSVEHLQGALLLCPPKVRDMYFATEPVVEALDPDAGLRRYQAIFIKEFKEIHDDLAEALCIRVTAAPIHYLMLRAHSLELFPKSHLECIADGYATVNTVHMLEDLARTLPQFRYTHARRMLGLNPPRRKSRSAR